MTRLYPFTFCLFLLNFRIHTWYVARQNQVRIIDSPIKVQEASLKAPIEEHPILVDELEHLFTKSFESSHATLTLQFNRIKEVTKDFVSDTREGKSIENAKKNRYKNILPYDHNRVILPSSSQNTNDYINASEIKGYGKSGKWIATQGPTANTVNDLWRMVWEKQVKVIVMLANVVENCKNKCERYWPQPGSSQEYGTMKVFFNDLTEYGSYVKRSLSIEDLTDEYTSERREIIQFHFTAWPDHGVPATSSGLMRLCTEVRDMIAEDKITSPIVVHCSAGAGRTGTFIGLDYLIDEMNKTKQIDVYHVVYHMRQQRMEMVQTAKQYIFLHKLMAEVAIFGNTDHSVEKFDLILDEIATSPVNNESVQEFGKLRHLNNVAKLLPITIESTNVITYHVSSVDIQWGFTVEGYNQQDKIIVCKETPDQAENFWKLVAERKPAVIVTMDEPEDANVWPNELNAARSFGNFAVTLTLDSEERKNYSIETVYNDETIDVQHLAFLSWNDNHTLIDAKELVDLFQLINSIRSGERVRDILLFDKNVLTRSGVFCSMWNLVSRYNVEKKVDVFRAVKDVKDTLPNLQINIENYQDCYLCMKEYMASCSIYANFS